MNIKYEKGLYLSKITQLETYHTQLGEHLDYMESLKTKITTFWNDKEAVRTHRILAEEIRRVRSAMTDISTDLAVLRGIVEKQSGIESKQDQQLDTALEILSALPL